NHGSSDTQITEIELMVRNGGFGLDLTTGGTATSSTDNPPNEGDDQAFDDYTTTKWLALGDSSPWIAYQFSSSNKYVVRKYRLTAANDAGDRDLRTWYFEGSNDGTNWTQLDWRNNITWPERQMKREFTFENSTAYEYYRLNVVFNWGSGDTQLEEIELMEADPSDIATGKSGMASNITALADTIDKIHLAYVDGSDYVQYRSCAAVCTGNFSSATRLDTAATNTYVTASVNTANNNIYVLYLRSSTVYYKLYSGSWGSETNTNWNEGTSPTYLTSNYGDNGRIFAEWTSGSSSPYTINWDVIIIPENFLLFSSVAFLLPLAYRKRRKK
ncbi:MAG TPA: discoidin domain-containing protein, partial [Patescibacteria group bacterium]|nr:discoidin domain-containing protein [Patescibacteria group bacterium]